MKLAYVYPEHLGQDQARVLQSAATVRALVQEGVIVHLVVGRFAGLPERLAELGLAGLPGLKLEPVAFCQPGPGSRAPLSWHGLFHRSSRARLQALMAQGVRAALVRHLKLAAFLLDTIQPQGLKVIFEAHELMAQTGAEEGLPAAKLARLTTLEQKVLAGADKVAAISAPLAQALEPLAGGPVAVAPSGAAPEFFSVGEGVREPDLTAYAGSLGPWKGVDLLIEAMTLVPQGRLEIRGGQPDSKDWQRVTELAAGLKLGDRVAIQPRAGQETVRELLGRAQIAVWPGTGRQRIAREFTSPLKLFEYLAAGCAVVAPDVPAAAGVLRHGQNALLFAPDDPRSLADALRRLTDDPELAARLGRAGRELARGYTWQSRARIIISLLEELGA